MAPTNWNALSSFPTCQNPLVPEPLLKCLSLPELFPDPYPPTCLPWRLSASLMAHLLCPVLQLFWYHPRQEAINGLDYIQLIFVSHCLLPCLADSWIHAGVFSNSIFGGHVFPKIQVLIRKSDGHKRMLFFAVG